MSNPSFNIVDICKKHDLEALEHMFQSPLFSPSSPQKKKAALRVSEKIVTLFEECVRENFIQGGKKVLDYARKTLKERATQIALEVCVLEQIQNDTPCWSNLLFQSAYEHGGATEVSQIIQRSFPIKQERVHAILENTFLIEHRLPRVCDSIIYVLSSQINNGQQTAFELLKRHLTPEEVVRCHMVLSLRPGMGTDLKRLSEALMEHGSMQDQAWWDELLVRHDHMCQANQQYKDKITQFTTFLVMMEKHALLQTQSMDHLSLSPTRKL